MDFGTILWQLGSGLIVSVEIFCLTLLFSLPLGLVVAFGRMSRKVRISAAYRFIAVIIGFAVNYAAYFAEIYRGGIESMSKGQYEAAQVLGYGKAQTFFLIILPQVIKRILPSVTNEIITLVKDTSLAFVIAVAEMFTVAKQIAAAQTTVVPLMIAGAYYYVFNLLVALAMERIEKHYRYYEA